MKNYLIAIAALLCLNCAAVDKTNNKVNKNFINSSYLTAGGLGDQAMLDASNFKQFAFTYIMAMPKWKVADFEQPLDVIITQYVTNFSYPDTTAGAGLVGQAIDKVHKDGGKILLCFTGDDFIKITADDQMRQKFAAMMGAFVEKFDYDGVDLDWESTVDMTLHGKFMTDIRRELDKVAAKTKKTMYLTTALPEWANFTAEQAKVLSSCVDWVNIMCYDMGGGIWGSAASHNTPLDVIKAQMGNWTTHFPLNKLCVGLANYGFYYEGIEPGQRIEARGLAKCGRYCDYKELPAWQAAGWTERWDEKAQAPYYTSPDGKNFVTLDSRRSHDAKIEWIVNAGFRGIFWWVFPCDFVMPAKGEKYGSNFLIDNVTNQINKLTK